MHLSLITYTMTVILVVSAVYGLFLFRLLTKPVIVVVSQLTVAGFTEVLGEILKHKKINTSHVFNIYILIEFSLLMLANYLFCKKDNSKAVLIVVYIGYLFAWIFAITVNGTNVFASKVFLLSCIVLVPAYFNTLFKTVRLYEYPYQEPQFWISLATIIYFGAVIPLFAMFSYFETKGKIKLGSYLYTINDVLALIRYVLVFYALTLFSRKKLADG